MSRSRSKKNRKKRTVPLLPNIITTLSLFSGFYSMMFSLKGEYVFAPVFILVSGFIDTLDGRVARATNSTSAFGKEYDSLSDVIAFGVAPAILVYLWKFSEYGRIGFLASFLFVACGALRLARFNSDTSGSMTTFTGLPIPVAAAAVASVVLLGRVVGEIPSIPVLAGVYLLSYMMVSNIKFPSFKHINYIKAHPFQLLVGALLLLVVIASAPEVMIFAFVSTFILGGLFWNCLLLIKGRSSADNALKEEKTLDAEQ